MPVAFWGCALFKVSDLDHAASDFLLALMPKTELGLHSVSAASEKLFPTKSKALEMVKKKPSQTYKYQLIMWVVKNTYNLVADFSFKTFRSDRWKVGGNTVPFALFEAVPLIPLKTQSILQKD